MNERKNLAEETSNSKVLDQKKEKKEEVFPSVDLGEQLRVDSDKKKEGEEKKESSRATASKESKGISDKRNLDFILDIPLELTVELGRTRILINDLLQLGQGSVIELNKLAGEPLEILVNERLVARGEAVVVNEKFGIRLTDVISPLERVKQLG